MFCARWMATPCRQTWPHPPGALVVLSGQVGLSSCHFWLICLELNVAWVKNLVIYCWNWHGILQAHNGTEGWYPFGIWGVVLCVCPVVILRVGRHGFIETTCLVFLFLFSDRKRLLPRFSRKTSSPKKKLFCHSNKLKWLPVEFLVFFLSPSL